MAGKTHVIVLYTAAGGGHKATAEALKDLLEHDGSYRVTLVNPYREVIPDLDVYARFSRYGGEEVYNDLLVAKGRTGLICTLFYAVIMLGIVIQAPKGRRAMREYFQHAKPDLVISVLPMLNRIVADSLTELAPFAVLMTDWMEMKRYSWYPKGHDYYALCGTVPGLKQLAAGLQGKKVFPLSGLLIRPAFSRDLPDRAGIRRSLDLDADRPTLCLLYGGGGNRRMRDLALALRDLPSGKEFEGQVIFLCGRNGALARELRDISWPFPVMIKEFTDEVHRYLGVADIFVGKPGPGSVSEALASGLFLLLDRTSAMPQERCILKWVEQEGLGKTFTDAKGFTTALAGLCKPGGLSALPPHPLRGRGSNLAARELPAVIGELLALEAQDKQMKEP